MWSAIRRLATSGWAGAVAARQVWTGLLVLIGVLNGGSAFAQHAAGRLPSRGVDLDGNVHLFGENDQCRALVFAFLSTKCPISNSYVPLLNDVSSRFHRQGVRVYGVISDPSVTRQEAREHRRQFHVAFPVLFDGSGGLRRTLSPTHTPHAIVLDRSGEQLYSGALDDHYVKLGRKKETATEDYLVDALEAVLAGRIVEVPKTKPIGCLLEAPPNKAASGDVTFSRDIAPIVHAHCSGCHHPDGSGPFALLTYEDVSAHARQILEVTHSRFMPPWKPSTRLPRFRDEQRLCDQDLELLESWVRSGKPEGNPEDLPVLPEPSRGWRLGKPDLVLEMKDVFNVPASGPDLRQYFVLPTGLTENRLVSAIDFQPGTPNAIHHASFFLDTQGNGRKLDQADPGPGYGGFGGPQFQPQGTLTSWFPGMRARRLPEGMGRLIPRGSDLVAEVHYVSTGKPEQDRSKIGLYFAPRSARQVVTEVQVGSLHLEIPAGAERHKETALYTLPVDTTLLDVVPHMHVLGREMKVRAKRPDGKIVPLLWIKDWDFNWQGQYAYDQPVELPKGSRILVEAWYDNSSGNPLNPNTPPKTVHWGSDSTDEMLICHFQCTCESMQDLKELNEDQQRYVAAEVSRRPVQR
ncbi:redoxin domain-containing protein [Roseiconus nitratireducens]|uniref:Redoxin domain-containing protein n=1 Tax=Roseiconus nitratireducens TaxID=2605748 RepID=A0A5M6D5I4_9BACT|nr:redoxin domain-containing protein [Roseiconus nitratireducens]KAA5542764.1 redoxin domain-containing protein [Roseiconus nitratireducens]